MNFFLQTKRLILKVPTEEDFANQFVLQSDPELMKYMIGGARSEKMVRERLAREIQHYAEYGYSFGCVYEKSSGCFVGRAGAIHFKPDSAKSNVEIGCIFLKEYWKKGYGTEILKGLIDWVFKTTDIPKVIAACHPENKSSQHVLEKAGMHFVGIRKYDNTDSMFYEIDK